MFHILTPSPIQTGYVVYKIAHQAFFWVLLFSHQYHPTNCPYPHFIHQMRASSHKTNVFIFSTQLRTIYTHTNYSYLLPTVHWVSPSRGRQGIFSHCHSVVTANCTETEHKRTTIVIVIIIIIIRHELGWFYFQFFQNIFIPFVVKKGCNHPFFWKISSRLLSIVFYPFSMVTNFASI